MPKNEDYQDRIDDLFSEAEPPRPEPVEGEQPLETEPAP
jgi:hypothetical protein